MRVLDLFSGIGGFSIGLERAGMQTIAFCERDEFCRAVLAKHWPGVPCFPNISHIGPAEVEQLGSIGLVCGGFPCQPFSLAGKRAGGDDERHLWPAMRRIIEWARSPWVLLENTPGIVTLGLDGILSDLESVGYTARPFVIPACAVDARHRRDRVWVVATNLPNAGPRGRQGPRHQKRRRPQPIGWDPEPALGRMAARLPRRMDRLERLGNTVVPQIVEELGRAIMSTG